MTIYGYGKSNSASPISVAWLQSTLKVPSRPGNRALATREPIIAWEPEAGKPSDLKPTDVEGSHLCATIAVTARDKLLAS